MEIKEERPWGWFTTISKGHDFLFNIIIIERNIGQ